MKRSIVILLASVLIVILGSCTDKDLNPIFYTLENERALEDDRGMPNDSNVQEMVRAGSYNLYFAAAKRLYSRSASAGGNWSVLGPPVTGGNCDILGVFGGSDYVYAGFYTDSGNGLGLWYWDQGATSWAQVTDTNTNLQNNDQIYMIDTANSNLFVAVGIYNSGTGSYDSFDLYYSSTAAASAPFDEATFDLGTGAADTIDVPVTDIAWDGANTYWAIAGPYLFEDTDGLASLDFTLVAGGPTNPGVQPFGGLLYSTTLTRFYVSTTDGELWSYNGTWTGPESVQVDDEAVRFTRFVDVTAVSGDILVGSQGTGYFRLIGGDIANTERFQEYNVTGVYNGAINSFLLDTVPDPDLLFACTYGDGLWRANYSGSEWIWIQE